MNSVRAIFVAAGVLTWVSPLCLGGDRMDIHTAAAVGDLKQLDVLLRDVPGLVNKPDASGYTPLHMAVRSLHVQAAKKLLAAGADVNAKDRHGATALHMVLLAGGDAKEMKQRRESLTALLIENGADAKAVDERGKSPLHMAAIRGSIELLDLLAKAGAEVAARDRSGRTPLHDAALYNHISVITWLLSKEVDLNAADTRGDTPLHCAVLRFRKAAAERLIAGGAKVNAKNKSGATPLHLTGSAGPEEKEVDHLMTAVAKVLLTHGAEINAADRAGFTPLHYALEKNREGLAALLRSHGATE